MLLKLGSKPIRLGKLLSNWPRPKRMSEKCKTFGSESLGHGFSYSEGTSCFKFQWLVGKDQYDRRQKHELTGSSVCKTTGSYFKRYWFKSYEGNNIFEFMSHKNQSLCVRGQNQDTEICVSTLPPYLDYFFCVLSCTYYILFVI